MHIHVSNSELSKDSPHPSFHLLPPVYFSASVTALFTVSAPIELVAIENDLIACLSPGCLRQSDPQCRDRGLTWKQSPTYSSATTQSLPAHLRSARSPVPCRFLVPGCPIPHLPAIPGYQNQPALSAALIRQSTLPTAQP